MHWRDETLPAGSDLALATAASALTILALLAAASPRSDLRVTSRMKAVTPEAGEAGEVAKTEDGEAVGDRRRGVMLYCCTENIAKA